MATEPTTWIALSISCLSLGVSGFVAVTNIRYTKVRRRMELLTRVYEARIQYGELNKRYQALCVQENVFTPEVLDNLLKYEEYEKLTSEYYNFVGAKDLSATESEKLIHHFDSLLLCIASDFQRIDELEKRKKQELT